MNKSTMILAFILMFMVNSLEAKKVRYDGIEINPQTFFCQKDTKYVLRYTHQFQHEITIPSGCEIRFEGGGLEGPIYFNNTLLTGKVKLQGSLLSGKIANKSFRSEWLCYRDDVRDDAANINQMIKICDDIIFTSGIYRMKTPHIPTEKLNKKLWTIRSHVGINRSNVSLRGIESSVVFHTQDVSGMIFVYSLPNDIPHSIKNIKIENITFKTDNDGKEFHEFYHCIKTMGVNGLTIKNCKFMDYWGDAICLSHWGDDPSTGERTRNSNVVISGNTIIGGEHFNTGCGIGVISGYNVTIDHNIIKRTSKDHMPGAIDIEANNTAYTVERITISNNKIENCRGTAGGICINANEKGAPAHHIRILYNHISNCTSGLAFVVKADNTTSDYQVIGNVIEKDTRPYQFIGKGKSKNWVFKNNQFKRFTLSQIPGNIKVTNLTIKTK